MIWNFNSMNKKLTIYFLLFILLFITSCDKIDFSLLSAKTRLTSNKWVMKSFNDYHANTSFPVTKTTYQFKEDGTYIITPANLGEPVYSTWEFFDHNDYLRIGNNKFKISYLSKKLLGLQYGNLMIFYVPTE